MDSFNSTPCAPQLYAHSPPLYMRTLERTKTSSEKNTYSIVWTFISRKKSQSGTVQSRKCPDIVSTGLRRAWNGNQCVLFSLFREPGSPHSSLVSTDPTIAPCLMALQGATDREHNKTLTQRPHSTRVYHHTTIFQPNTVNRDKKGWKCQDGRGRGEQDGKRGRGEGEEGHKMKHTLTYAYVCDWCVHNNTIDNHHRHSHYLLNLVFTEKYQGMEKQKVGLGEKRRPWR